LTWVEEMACSLYRTTAHVAILYSTSSSEEDPLQLHGNACAHPMDMFRNAKQLPWSPSDLNDLISIIFVGPRQLNQKDLQKLAPYYFVRRSKLSRLRFLEGS